MSLKNDSRMKLNKDAVLWLGLLFAGILLFFVIGGQKYQLTNDSLGYIHASYEREPLYPLLLRLFQKVFGERRYLQILVWFQSMAALVVCLYTAWFFKRYFDQNRPEWILSALLIMMPFFFDSMWSAPRINFTRYITTDWLSYTFFYLFVICLLQFLDTAYVRHYLALAVITGMMVLNRSQMQNCYVIMLLAIGIVCFRKKRSWKSALLRMGTILAGTVMVTGMISYLYCYVMWGEFARSSENDFTMLSNLLYASDAADENLFDGEQREAFAVLYGRVEERKLTYRHAKNAFTENGMYLMKSHDPIKYEVIRPFFREYAAEKGMEENFAGDQVKKRLASALKEKLLRKHFFRWIWDGICMMPYGLMLAVTPIIPARYTWICGLYTVCFWIAVIVLLVKSGIRDGKVMDFALCILFYVLVNTASCSMIIFVNARYLNYTQGLVYIALGLLLRATVDSHKIFRKRK